MKLELGGTTWCWTEINLPHMEPRMILRYTLENVIIPLISHEIFPNR